MFTTIPRPVRTSKSIPVEEFYEKGGSVSAEGVARTVDPRAPFEVRDRTLVDHIVLDLRVEAWRSVGVLREGEFPPDICCDKHDEHATHWAVAEEERVIAAARMCIHDTLAALPDAGFFLNLPREIEPPVAAINRLVVKADHQRRGLARRLDEVRIERALEMNCRSVIVVAPPIRWRPLEQLGFESLGTVNLSAPPDWLRRIAATTPQIERRVMLLQLNR